MAVILGIGQAFVIFSYLKKVESILKCMPSFPLYNMSLNSLD